MDFLPFTRRLHDFPVRVDYLSRSRSTKKTHQVFYDFGSDRKFVTLTLEMFKQDKWGNTYFFVDHDFNLDQMTDPDTGNKYEHNMSQGGTYTEISRALNFWQNSKLKNLSLHVEYNGGIYKDYPINNAWLFGVEYFMHDKSFKNTRYSSATSTRTITR